MEIFDYVVLGAGLGGLAAAACLSKQGKKVAVFEKHYLPGGCCHTFDYGEYSFCADVHYISQCGKGEAIDQFLKYIERNISFNSLDANCIDKIITSKLDFDIPLGWGHFRKRLLNKFPQEALAINCYCDEIHDLHQQISEFGREISWYEQKWQDWLKLPKYWHLFSRRNWTLQDLYDHINLSRELQAILAGQSGDYALPPSEIALITHACLVWDYSKGAYYPKHHFRHFVDTIIESITDNGGIVKLSTPVEHIQVDEGEVTSIMADGKAYQAANAYISDIDPKLTVGLMHDSQALSKREYQRLTSYEYSTSAFNIYLGLDSRFKPEDYGIGNWNIWYYPTGDLNAEYEKQLEGDMSHPWIFLSCPTMKTQEPGIAPQGHHVLEIATVCPHEPFEHLHKNDPKAYKIKKREVYQHIMNSVRDFIPDVDKYARMKVYGTPTTSEFYLGQPQGNIYGANLIPSQIGLNRLGYATELPNLFFVGASAGYPSVPGVISNGMDVVELITGKSIRCRNKISEDLVSVG